MYFCDQKMLFSDSSRVPFTVGCGTLKPQHSPGFREILVPSCQIPRHPFDIVEERSVCLNAVVSAVVIVVAESYEYLRLGKLALQFQREKLHRLHYKLPIALLVFIVGCSAKHALKIVRQQVSGEDHERGMRIALRKLLQRRLQQPPVRVRLVLAEPAG